MVRPHRRWLRLYLILVLGMGLLGAWYATAHWQIRPQDLDLSAFNQNGDWIDFIAALGEEVIQLFFGVTSGS
ncbi:hypothetical protein FKZ61_005260 [Litorilinea aerophila]|uniref:Phosphonate ABC transporter, permease protein PhnE n=1 Tax=Litorilinea aerophila TaxID=1204385 RepID=A0A540VJY6_9CHLR|nr:hypothetical protein [Litorilinea aerophila]MCC9075519.1 hypothetical protein [Litorilinea aerophila]OUC06402.1 hypothetical protein RY27_21245 [Litorilinea aerophila]GIV76405.1 MAG: hypothetical protein KatS3mg050_0799 [Litorilinea sp.]